MVAQQYGPQVRSDVISDAVQASFNDAVREQNLRVAGYPRIEPQATATTPADGALEFSAVFEVYPEVKLGDLAAIAIERPQVEVTRGRRRPHARRAAQAARRVRAGRRAARRPATACMVDFTGTIDGVEFAGGQAKDFAITLGEGRMLPEFEAALAGMRPARPGPSR